MSQRDIHKVDIRITTTAGSRGDAVSLSYEFGPRARVESYLKTIRTAITRRRGSYERVRANLSRASVRIVKITIKKKSRKRSYPFLFFFFSWHPGPRRACKTRACRHCTQYYRRRHESSSVYNNIAIIVPCDDKPSVNVVVGNGPIKTDAPTRAGLLARASSGTKRRRSVDGNKTRGREVVKSTDAVIIKQQVFTYGFTTTTSPREPNGTGS